MRIIAYFLFFFTLLYSQSEAPADYWMKLSQGEKVAFVNGAYGGVARMILHHEREVQNQNM